MEYLTSLLGTVAVYGVRADHAARHIIDRTIDEFALAVCQKTGLSFDFLTGLKADIAARVSSGTVTEPGTCRGRTKYGAPCKKRVLLGYCELHRDQEDLVDSKRRRVQAHVSRSSHPKARYDLPRDAKITVSHGRFRF